MSEPYPKVSLGEVLIRRKDSIVIQDLEEYKRLTIRINGGGIVLRDTLLGNEIGTKRQFIVSKGQLLLSKIDARNGAFGVVPNECDGAIITGNFWTFDAHREKLDIRYLNYLTKTRLFVDSCIRASEGTTNRLYLQEDLFLCQEIPLPPLSEQRRIVARIEELAGKVEEARGLRRQAVEEAEALFSSETRDIYSALSQSGRQIERLEHFLIDTRYGTSEKTTSDDTGTPILRMGNIQDGRLELQNLKYLHLDEKASRDLFLQKGDVLVNRTNSAELVGKCAVFDLDEKVSFASYLIRLRLDSSRADSRFVASYINSSLGRAYMFREKTQMTGQANVNAAKLKAMPVPIPTLQKQRRTVAYLNGLKAQVDSLKQLQSETDKELEALIPSILDGAFAGKL